MKYYDKEHLGEFIISGFFSRVSLMKTFCVYLLTHYVGNIQQIVLNIPA